MKVNSGQSSLIAPSRAKSDHGMRLIQSLVMARTRYPLLQLSRHLCERGTPPLVDLEVAFHLLRLPERLLEVVLGR